MALPSLENLNALEALRIHVQENLFIHAHLLSIGKSVDQISYTEWMWLLESALNGGLVEAALRDLTPNDIIELWGSKYPHKKQPGNHYEFIYIAALGLLHSTKKRQMKIYRELVLPYLVEHGEIATDDKGEPDPFQERAARKNFLDAMYRLNKKINPNE